MSKLRTFTQRYLFAVVVSLSIIGCQPAKPVPTATQSATKTPAPTATKTPLPTWTPYPSPTPDLLATQQYNDMADKVKEYAQYGYISSSGGKYSSLGEFEDEWAQIDWYRWTPAVSYAIDFIIRSDIEWQVASPAANESGCGFVFRLQSNNDHYLAFISQKGYVGVAVNQNNNFNFIGQGKYGSASQNGSANFAIIAQGNTFRILVNDKLIKLVTGVKGKLTSGGLAYTVLSGINSDFGTRCTFKNTALWDLP